MRSPDATDVERIEGLLRGMPPETEREAHLEGMVRELRSVSPRASHELREHVRTLREPDVRRSLGWRPALVLVPLALAFAGAVTTTPTRAVRSVASAQRRSRRSRRPRPRTPTRSRARSHRLSPAAHER